MHVVLIHFPIALFLTGCLFDLLSLGNDRPAMAATAYFNLLGAALMAIPTALTGLLAWRFALGGARLKGLLLLHLLFGASSAFLIVLVGWIQLRAHRRATPLPRYRFSIEIATAVLVGLTAHLGGFLTAVNGP